MSAVKSIGKTKIDVTARGCHDCGTTYSFSWHTFKTVHISIADSIAKLEIPICGSCMKKRKRRGQFVPSVEFCQ